MAVKPILFNSEMVQAILDGRKTETRRIVPEFKGQTINAIRTISPEGYPPDVFFGVRDSSYWTEQLIVARPPCSEGDILWVRETWRKDGGRYMYKADYAPCERFYRNGQEVDMRWKPSIHMPREAARIYLEVKDVRLHRLDWMDEEDAIREGIKDNPAGEASPLEAFYKLWDTTVRREDLRTCGASACPWVWVIKFRRMTNRESLHLGKDDRPARSGQAPI